MRHGEQKGSLSMQSERFASAPSSSLYLFIWLLSLSEMRDERTSKRSSAYRHPHVQKAKVLPVAIWGYKWMLSECEWQNSMRRKEVCHLQSILWMEHLPDLVRTGLIPVIVWSVQMLPSCLRVFWSIQLIWRISWVISSKHTVCCSSVKDNGASFGPSVQWHYWMITLIQSTQLSIALLLRCEFQRLVNNEKTSLLLELIEMKPQKILAEKSHANNAVKRLILAREVLFRFFLCFTDANSAESTQSTPRRRRRDEMWLIETTTTVYT